MLFPWQQQPEELKSAIQAWSAANQENWQIWWDAYNTVYDLSVGESWEESGSGEWKDGEKRETDQSGNTSGNVSSTGHRQDGGTNSENRNSDRKQPGYNNTSALISVEQMVENRNGQDSRTIDTNDTTNSSSESSGKTTVEGSRSGDDSYHKLHTSHNSGLSIMDAMVRVFAGRRDTDVYKMIAEQFEAEFLMRIY